MIVVCERHECTTVGVYLDVMHADHGGHSTRVREGVWHVTPYLYNAVILPYHRLASLAGIEKNKHK